MDDVRRSCYLSGSRGETPAWRTGVASLGPSALYEVHPLPVDVTPVYRRRDGGARAQNGKPCKVSKEYGKLL